MPRMGFGLTWELASAIDGCNWAIVKARLRRTWEFRLKDTESSRPDKLSIPAASLAYLGDLFKVPLFYFFQDLSFGEEDVEPSRLDEPPVLVVATTEDRLDALVRDFLKAEQEGQCYLLLLARAFAKRGDVK